jgi:ATP-binding cassette subfamily G (WHITE) protein 2 (SNQ2)
MENEFSRIDLTCTAESMVPIGPGYDDVASQVCTLPGSIPGTNVIAGSDYMKSGFSYDPGDLWRNFGIIFVIIAAFLIANAALGEYITFGTGTDVAKVYVKPNKDRKRLNKTLIERRDRRRYSGEAQGSKLHIASKAILTWECLNYVVPTPAGKLRLLNNVYGYVKPGELTALMGVSGSGKTTLLDVLAARKTIGVITGDILVDGIKPGIAFQRGISYAEQLDVHEPTQTVREALRFSADLRQPIDVPQTEKYAYIEEVLSLLEMEDLADAIIGELGAGLSVEQRKRVTIGVELAAKPELLLFLDEPVSIPLNR